MKSLPGKIQGAFSKILKVEDWSIMRTSISDLFVVG